MLGGASSLLLVLKIRAFDRNGSSIFPTWFTWHMGPKGSSKKSHCFFPDSGLEAKTNWWLNHPSEKYARQIGSFPQGSFRENQKHWNHHLATIYPPNININMETNINMNHGPWTTYVRLENNGTLLPAEFILEAYGRGFGLPIPRKLEGSPTNKRQVRYFLNNLPGFANMYVPGISKNHHKTRVFADESIILSPSPLKQGDVEQSHSLPLAATLITLSFHSYFLQENLMVISKKKCTPWN